MFIVPCKNFYCLSILWSIFNLSRFLLLKKKGNETIMKVKRGGMIDRNIHAEKKCFTFFVRVSYASPPSPLSGTWQGLLLYDGGEFRREMRGEREKKKICSGVHGEEFLRERRTHQGTCRETIQSEFPPHERIFLSQTSLFFSVSRVSWWSFSRWAWWGKMGAWLN